ncbi:hypothetical protein NDU88_005483 [Pleurodeles waltl]|uniref:Uncharacterized protein n=1 Tax=Pleurodeles waltl TaxID=8319 RepID=A0AAV7TVH3_PLEWA|nr:hypothetical protein NDU88_005483 [Pleurodeles waltl]
MCNVCEHIKWNDYRDLSDFYPARDNEAEGVPPDASLCRLRSGERSVMWIAGEAKRGKERERCPSRCKPLASLLG